MEVSGWILGFSPSCTELQGQDGFLWVGVTSASLFWGWWTSLSAVPHHFYGWCWTQSDPFPLNLSIALLSRNSNINTINNIHY